MQEPGKKIIGEHEAAKLINMSVYFLRQARCDGAVGNHTPGPPYYRVGRRISYNVEDLNAWLSEHRCE